MTMEKVFNHKKIEDRIYKMWEKGGYFTPKKKKGGKPFTVILPPPNASGKMHVGNVFMIALEDLMIRWHRMRGEEALWVPGTDHAGFETQITFERELKEVGKSRFDYDRNTLYQKIHDFVKDNRKLIDDQIRSLGASCDWSRYKFTLDEDVIDTVYKTFKKMHQEDLVYRDDYLVNYCPKCGTTFADLEVRHIERKDPLYYMKYGPFILATVRPETKFGDTAIAVHPDDKRYKKYVGKEVEVEGLIGKFKMEVIADKFVDPEFGTGVVKVTPAHDKNDYEVGLKHGLEIKSVIDLNGKLNEHAGPYVGMEVLEARKKVVTDLEKRGLMAGIDKDYEHSVSVCYKRSHDIEPTILPNWFIKVDKLKKPAYEVVKSGEVKIFPKWREKTYLRWMEEMRDWPISRQVVWGIRVPAWYSVKKNPNLLVTFLNSKGDAETGKVSELLTEYKLGEIKKGLQTLIAPKGASFKISADSPGNEFLQETDTFDTWYSSGHWPLVTLGYPSSSDFKYFYPTNVMETGWEILRFWVSRMIMFGIYLTGKPPFDFVYLHGLVRAIDGKKMSKSLGNIINPEEYLEEFGVDALRMGLIAGSVTGKDFAFPRDKVIGYRNFTNKIWNMARFILGRLDSYGYKKYEDLISYPEIDKKKLKKEDKEIVEKLDATIKSVDISLEKFRFADAGDIIYHFMWDDLASNYLELAKNRMDSGEEDIPLSVLRYIYINCLKLLHPFMPFVTEEIWGKIPRKFDDPLIVSRWPGKVN